MVLHASFLSARSKYWVLWDTGRTFRLILKAKKSFGEKVVEKEKLHRHNLGREWKVFPTRRLHGRELGGLRQLKRPKTGHAFEGTGRNLIKKDIFFFSLIIFFNNFWTCVDATKCVKRIGNKVFLPSSPQVYISLSGGKMPLTVSCVFFHRC